LWLVLEDGVVLEIPAADALELAALQMLIVVQV